VTNDPPTGPPAEVPCVGDCGGIGRPTDGPWTPGPSEPTDTTSPTTSAATPIDAHGARAPMRIVEYRPPVFAPEYFETELKDAALGLRLSEQQVCFEIRSCFMDRSERDRLEIRRVSRLDDSIDNMGLGYVSYIVPGPAIGVTIAKELTDYFGGRSQHTSVPPNSPSSPPAPNIPHKRPSHATTAPLNLSPAGAGRNGAFREAKRQNGIPVSRQPSRVTPNLDKRGNPQPGRTYEFDQGPGKDPIRIRDDADGHYYGPGDPQNRGPHFNDPAGNHYDY
jgi:hypothetical protein